MVFQTEVAGIPCQCEVTQYNPGTDMVITGSGFGDAIAPEHETFEFLLLDRKGYPAPWLENKLNSDDYARLQQEYLN